MIEDGVIHVGVEMLLWMLAGVVVPTILFLWRLHTMNKRTLDMHLAPDDHGFGTRHTNALLDQHMKDELEMHSQSIVAMDKLTHVIGELSYYVRWMGTQQTGKKPPPYVSETG